LSIVRRSETPPIPLDPDVRALIEKAEQDTTEALAAVEKANRTAAEHRAARERAESETAEAENDDDRENEMTGSSVSSGGDEDNLSRVIRKAIAEAAESKDGALAKMEAKAVELRKADPRLTATAAKERVRQDNPELAKALHNEMHGIEEPVAKAETAEVWKGENPGATLEAKIADLRKSDGLSRSSALERVIRQEPALARAYDEERQAA